MSHLTPLRSDAHNITQGAGPVGGSEPEIFRVLLLQDQNRADIFGHIHTPKAKNSSRTVKRGATWV